MKGQKHKMTWFKKGRWTIKKTVVQKKNMDKICLKFWQEHAGQRSRRTSTAHIIPEFFEGLFLKTIRG